MILQKTFTLSNYGAKIIQSELVGDKILILALSVAVVWIDVDTFEMKTVGKQSLGSVFGAIMPVFNFNEVDVSDNSAKQLENDSKIYISRNNGFLSIARVAIDKSVKFESK